MAYNPAQFMQARHKARLAQSQQDEEAKRAQDLHQQALEHQKRLNAVELAAKKADLEHQKAMNAAKLARAKKPPAKRPMTAPRKKA